jgi:hypothetical protein
MESHAEDTANGLAHAETAEDAEGGTLIAAGRIGRESLCDQDAATDVALETARENRTPTDSTSKRVDLPRSFPNLFSARAASTH